MAWLDLTPDEWTAVRLSIKVASWAMVASLPPGIAVALLLARGRFWGKSVLNGIVHLPLILPPVVTGYLLLLSFGRRGPIGAFLADNRARNASQLPHQSLRWPLAATLRSSVSGGTLCDKR